MNLYVIGQSNLTQVTCNLSASLRIHIQLTIYSKDHHDQQVF